MEKRHPGRVLIGAGLTLLLAACSPSAPPTETEVNPYAGGVSYPWSYEAPSTKLTTLSLTPGVNTLYYEPLLAARNAWGPIEINRSNGEQRAGDGKTITLNGKTYTKGFGVHAGSEMRYSLQGTGATCTTLMVDVGVDDEVGNRGSVNFQVFLDGVKTYDSGKMTGASATKKVNVNLTGARELRMVVTNGGDNIDYDHADWANPTITCVSSTPPAQPAGTLDPSFGQGGRVKVSGVDVVAEPGGAVAVVGKNFKVTRLSASGAVVAQSTDQFDGQANGLARQSDGKLIVAGQVDGQLAAIRFLSNLTLDSSFGAGGVVKLPLGGTNTSELGSSALDVAVQPDGKIVLGGRVRQQFNQDFVLVRLQSNGTRDASFGQNGVAITALEDLPAYSYASGISDEFISGLALQPDGKIVVAGQASGGFGDEAVLARYSSSGQLDASFSGDGIAKGIIDGYGGFRTVAVLPDGELLAGGSTQRALARAFLQKFSADGMPGSRVVFNFNDENYLESETIIYALAVQDDGGVIVGGGNQAFSSVNTDGTYLARFSAALVQDTTFGGAADGNVKINGDTFIALANSGNTIVATTPSADPVGGTVRVFR